MATTFKYLDTAYKDDVVAAALISREQEIFHYEFNIQNFQHILNNTQDLTLKADMEQRLVSENRELAKSKGIYNALLAQITDQNAHMAAVARVKAK